MGRNILVVEDDRNICDLIHMYLVKEGFDVRIAGDGGKAIEEFQKQVPDLILLDIMLPVMDGWAVCAKIRETSKVPIIMLTAKGEVFDRIQGLEMGADDYVVKPFEMKELIARIKTLGCPSVLVINKVDTLEHNGVTYHALFPASQEDEESGEPVDVDADDEEYGLVIMKTVEENGEELLSTLDSDEEIEEIYNLFMERFFQEEDE